MSYEACPNANEACKYWDNKHGCRVNTHHEYYPARDYKTPVEKEFRELPVNKERLCMAEHDQIHATERPPLKPSHDEMVQAIAAYAIGEVA